MSTNALRSSNQIHLPTLDGDPYEVIPGVELSLRHGETMTQPVIIEGYIGSVGGPYKPNIGFYFNLRLWRTKELPDNILKIMVIQLEGEDWKRHVEHGPFPGDDGELFQAPVPIVLENGAVCTSTQSNALKLVILEKDGFYSEHTVTVVAQRDRFYLVHQHNYDRIQIFSDEDGAFLPMNRSKGKQPKRLALKDIIVRAFKGVELPTYQGQKFNPAPTGAGLKSGEARVLWWSAHRQVGGAVTHTQEQVRISWKDIRIDRDGEEILDHEVSRALAEVRGSASYGLRYFEPGTVVGYKHMIDSRGKTSYRHDLVGVYELQPVGV